MAPKRSRGRGAHPTARHGSSPHKAQSQIRANSTSQKPTSDPGTATPIAKANHGYDAANSTITTASPTSQKVDQNGTPIPTAILPPSAHENDTSPLPHLNNSTTTNSSSRRPKQRQPSIHTPTVSPQIATARQRSVNTKIDHKNSGASTTAEFFQLAVRSGTPTPVGPRSRRTASTGKTTSPASVSPRKKKTLGDRKPASLIVRLKIPKEGSTKARGPGLVGIGYDMAPVNGRGVGRGMDEVDVALKKTVQDLFEIQAMTLGYVDGTDGELVKKIETLTTTLQNLQSLVNNHTTPQQVESNYRQSSPSGSLPLIPREIIGYVDEGRNPDIYTREFMESILRYNQNINGKRRAFGDFTRILAEEMKKGIPGVGGEVDRVMREREEALAEQ